MEQNQFEGLEEIEVTDVKSEEEVKGLKEYEKLLLAERDRNDYEKALNLIKFGCFEQKEETTMDYSKFEKINNGTKYKGLYSLYRNLETMQLLFIAELVENNKGDEDERKDMKPYAYDVIYLEQMDDETYKAVCHAGKNNVSNGLSTLVICADIFAILTWVLTLVTIIVAIIAYTDAGYKGAQLLINLLVQPATLFGFSVVLIPLIVLMHIKYKKYKEQ